jgi:hypothetical protein
MISICESQILRIYSIVLFGLGPGYQVLWLDVNMLPFERNLRSNDVSHSGSFKYHYHSFHYITAF